MPTPSGLPKRGEVWERRFRLPEHGVWHDYTMRFVVIERGTGSYWPLRIFTPGIRKDGGELVPSRQQIQLCVDAAYWFGQRELHYIGIAGPETKKKLNLT